MSALCPLYVRSLSVRLLQAAAAGGRKGHEKVAAALLVRREGGGFASLLAAHTLTLRMRADTTHGRAPADAA